MNNFSVGNLFWGNHLRYFGDKISLDEPQVLSRSFHAKITQSTTAITSIVIRLANQLRIKRGFLALRHCEANHRFAETIHTYRHSERSEESKKST